MSRMIVVAIKLTGDIDSMKIVYERNGRLFVRSGSDGFSVGKPLQSPLRGLGKWGFKLVEPNPEFRDAEEIIDNLDRFSMKNDGTIQYYGY